MRTKERIEKVEDALKRKGLVLSLDDNYFGMENKDDWIILSYVEPKLLAATSNKVKPINPEIGNIPPDKWFELMENRSFESEREVEHYFIIPLL